MIQLRCLRLAAAIVTLAIGPGVLRGELAAAGNAPSSEAVDAEVVFVLDTTGSMSGLIEGAKQKIWSIATDILKASGGKVRIGLVGYRDRGDQYVTRRAALTDDLDAIYGELQKFTADGGGDGPESVNQALYEAVTDFRWSADPRVMKTVFLVGDYPPHMDYVNDIRYPESCRLARSKHIVINTVQCGDYASTTAVWREIATLADGDFAAIAQSGNMQAVATPFDDEIARTTRELDATVIPYGSDAQQSAIRSKLLNARASEASVSAARNAYKMESAADAAAAPAVYGRGDLVRDSEAQPEIIKQLKLDELPAEYRGLSPDELRTRIAELSVRRAAVNKRLAELNEERNRYLRKNSAAAVSKADSFDAQVRKSVTTQLQKHRLRNTL